MIKKYLKSEINLLEIAINKPFLIYLKWDLWAWKTTISKHIINNLLWVSDNITSPTYTYYNKYVWNDDTQIYHFDLYRLKNYDEFFSIWAEEILDNNAWVILVEWPELIENYYKPDLEIIISKTEREDEREIEIK
jgi:tRNA threonylcarbamoyladenosine biosynthesis protein TsaE